MIELELIARQALSRNSIARDNISHAGRGTSRQ